MRPCPACARHVRETTCPFCGALVPAATRSVFAGPVTRAAVFSALAGCWTGSTPAEQQTTTVDHHTEQTAKPKPPASGTIEGTVTDSNSGAPIGYAQVTLVEANLAAQTDGQGHYKFEGVAPGTYTVRVMAQGNNPRLGGGVAQASVSVGDTGARVDMQIAMPTYRYNPNQTPMPYGAPPARRRIV